MESTNTKGFCNLLTLNFIAGLKPNKLAVLYNTFFLLRRFVLAMLILFSTDKAVQLVLYIIMNIAFTAYMAAVRPFAYKVQNFMSVFNEAILIICCFLMFAFFKEGSSANGAGVVMIILFTINIIV